MQRKYSIELLRLAFKKGFRVRGGASKLVSAYKKKYKPTDIFTYQDMTGEATPVYEHCGFTLIKQDKMKQYLVAPGKTLSTANRKSKELLTMPYATRWGPDAILKTSIGEVYREDGTRKSNKDLFVEELGWHVEEAPGDRLYEWVNPDLTFYTYKITASDSDKYYYGVSHIKKANASVDDCLEDGYFGSGGKKFQNWMVRHKAHVVKEIISIHSSRASAYQEEAMLVGDSWSSDALCLNPVAGGSHSALNVQRKISGLAEKLCAVHGQVQFSGASCFKCMAERDVQELECTVHGLTKHRGSTCYRCVASKSITYQQCTHHGLTKFKGKACAKCSTVVEDKICPEHGLVKHRGQKCYKCANIKANSTQHCEVHGDSKHKGNACYNCFLEASYEELTCVAHGATPHQKGKCLKCEAQKKW